MALFASGVQLPSDLSQSIGGVGIKTYNQIGSNYDAARKKLAADASARGLSGTQAVAPGSYADQRLNASKGLDVGNLEASLGGGLGNTAYQNALGERGYNQDMALTNEIADLNKPSMLEQVLGGAGAAGGGLAQLAGALRSGKKKSSSDQNPFNGLPQDQSNGPGYTVYNPATGEKISY